MLISNENSRWNFNFPITEKPLGVFNGMADEKKLHKIIEKTFFDLNKGKDIEKELIQYIEEYPNVAMLRNRLSSCYQLKSDYKKSKEVNLKTIEQFPDYVFAHISLAYDYFHEGNFEGMLETLGEKLELDALFPERKEFHIDEVVSYYKTVAFYLNEEEGNGEAFILIEKMIKKFPKHSEQIYQVERKMMEINVNRFIEGKEESIMVSGNFIQSLPASNEIPVFENEVINELYKYDFLLPKDTLTTILNLPEDSLERDLKKVFNSGITLYKYLLEEDVPYEETNFIIHALFIAAEKKFTDIFPELLAVLKGGNEFTSYYFIEEITRILWIAFFKLFGDNPTQLFILLKERSVDTFTKMVIDDAIEQVYYHYPEHQQSIIQSYKDLTRYIITNKEDSELKDTELFAAIACSMRDISLFDLNDEIKELYDNNLVAIQNAGKYKFLIKSERANEHRFKPVPDIFTMYNDQKLLEEEEDLKVNNKWLDLTDHRKEFAKPLEILPVRTEPKTGRNDPCPCGSGKKYKKCCLKEV